MQFVLVHGGWQGGWCWDAVSSVLRNHGHQVFAPTLRGSEEGEVDPSGVDLAMIGDGLVAAIKEKNLREVVLVGHSGGGPAIQYAADRLVENTRQVVFVDAWVLHDGESIHDVLPRPLVDNGRAAAAKSPDRTVPIDLAVWRNNFMNGASDSDIAEVWKRLVPVPIGWLDEPHEAMLTHPIALAEALLSDFGKRGDPHDHREPPRRARTVASGRDETAGRCRTSLSLGSSPR